MLRILRGPNYSGVGNEEVSLTRTFLGLVSKSLLVTAE